MKAPSVIIGVGGIGSYICAQIAQMMPENAPDSNMVRFAVMDTDINTIRDIQRKGFRGTKILLSDNMTVGKCRSIMHERIKDWYPVSEVFDRKSMTEGAGQQRAISRLALEYSIMEGKLSPLYRVIQELHELDINDSSQQITFYIISSLAGGTGSGIALPLAVHLNGYVLKQQGDSLSACKGFFLMSSTLENSVDSRLEQQSLDANAYAAVKELSALMQIADGDDEHYEELGKAFSNRKCTMSMTQKPHSYEYCFLFGMRNQNGRGIHSFEDLKEMVANAVYMQACSPMQERNSSREDNKLRHGTMLKELKGEKYLRRFGGIGCGELCYPRELLKEYYAIRWAKEVMQEQWKKYDLMYQKKEKEETEKKRRGHKWDVVERGEEYIRAVLSSDEQDIFAEGIKESCQMQIGGNTWDGYLDALHNEIGRRLDAEKNNNICNSAQDERMLYEYFYQISTIDKKKPLAECMNKIAELYPGIEDTVRSLPMQYKVYLGEIWFVPHLQLDDLPEYYMEYWLIKDGKFIHPNAVRYFLYQLRQAIKSRQQLIQDLCDAAQSKFSNMREKKIKNPLFGWEKYYERLREQYKSAWEALYDYAKEKLYGYILEKCKDCVDRLIKEYESFYDTYQQLLAEFDERIDQIETELDKKRGVGKAYVCADEACRESVVEEMKHQREFVQVDGTLSQYLYQLMWSQNWGKMDDEQKFQNIAGYWNEGLEKEFRYILSPHILHAMDMEAYYKSGRHTDAESMKERIRTVRRIMTNPFIQYWKTDNVSQGISICCYNSILNHQQGTFQEVGKWLKEQESVDDEYYCSPYRMVFYHSFVGLNASEVWEYLHINSEKKFPKGDAFCSYEEMVRNMGRSLSKETGLTPHTDKNWHSFRYMPDSQKDYQRWKEIEIGTAFLYAFLSGKIIYDDKKKEYGIRIYEVFGLYGMESEGKRLDDCLKILYMNQFLTEVLLKDMRRQIAVLRKAEIEPIKYYLENNSLWELFWRYSQELNGKEWYVYWKPLMLDAARLFVEECIGWDRTPDHMEECRKWLLDEFIRFKGQELKEGQNEAVLKDIERYCRESWM